MAVRRYRSTLRVFADVIDLQPGTNLGAVRDPNVLLALLKGDLEQLNDIVTSGSVANPMQSVYRLSSEKSMTALSRLTCRAASGR